MNSCYLTLQFLHSCVFSLLSQTHSASLFKLLFHLIWRVYQLKSENRRRFASKVGHLWYFIGLSCKIESPWRIAARSALTRPARTVSPERR